MTGADLVFGVLLALGWGCAAWWHGKAVKAKWDLEMAEETVDTLQERQKENGSRLMALEQQNQELAQTGRSAIRQQDRQIAALQHGIRVVGERERLKDSRVRELRIAWQDAALTEMERRKRQNAALKYGIRVLGCREQLAKNTASRLHIERDIAQKESRNAFIRGRSAAKNKFRQELGTLARECEVDI